jgi:hypothetical protein
VQQPMLSCASSCYSFTAMHLHLLACRCLCLYRPPNVFEVIAQLWNCPSFNPVAPASECHLDFQLATDCSYDLVAGLVPATPQKIEDCFTSIRSDLFRIVTRWEQSGQGEGGRDQEEDEEDAAVSAVDHNEDDSLTEGDLMSPTRHRITIGSLDRRPPCALQSRAAFLNGRPSYLLYFWEEADSHQLLQSSLQRLTNNTGAVDALSAPSVSTSTHSGSTHSDGSRNQHGRRHHRQEEQQDQQLFTPLMESVRDLAESQQQMRIDRERDRVHERDMEDKRRHSE